jgi:hypothetical protein
LSEGDGQIHSQLFTSSSTWTVPHGVARVKVYVIGGGAGGGGGYDDGDNPISGSPGGSGGFAVGEYDIIPGDVYTITVGQGGHANNFSGGSGYTGQYAGASGGTSSFTLSGGSTLISATGGTGTALGSSTIVQGTGSGGTLRNSSFINNGAGGSFNNQTDFPVNFASGIFNGGHRNASLDSSVSERTSWTISSEAAPGIGGLATTGSARAQGGVDGIVYLEWVEAAKGFQTANVQTFDTSGTWHKPDGLDGSSFVLVQMWGGGAGGIIHGLGGGGGGYTSAWYSLSELNSTETVTVGHGGAGGYNGSGSISTYNGGDTNFKNGYAYGGTTGDWNLNTLGFGGGGAFSGGTGGGFATEAGGFSENGGTSIYGGGGGAGVNEYGSYNGTGGSSMFGGAGGSGSSGNGTVPGGGGAGQTGSGAHGRVIVTIFGASTSSGGGNGFTTIPDTVTFTTTGSHSFVVPANVSKVKVTVVGGGGGAASTYYSPGSAYFAGGGGGTAIKVIKNLVPGTSIPIVVGAAGLTNTLPGGGTSSFGTYCSATGGTCGYGGGAPSFAGGGGIGINGDINLSGTPGTPALGISGLSGSDNPTYTPISDGIPGTSYLGLSYGGGGTNGIPATSGIVIVEY